MSIIKQEPGIADFYRGVPGTEMFTLDRPGEIFITSLPANGILPSKWEILTPENHAKAVQKAQQKAIVITDTASDLQLSPRANATHPILPAQTTSSSTDSSATTIQPDLQANVQPPQIGETAVQGLS